MVSTPLPLRRCGDYEISESKFKESFLFFPKEGGNFCLWETFHIKGLCNAESMDFKTEK